MLNTARVSHSPSRPSELGTAGTGNDPEDRIGDPTVGIKLHRGPSLGPKDQVSGYSGVKSMVNQ